MKSPKHYMSSKCPICGMKTYHVESRGCSNCTYAGPLVNEYCNQNPILRQKLEWNSYHKDLAGFDPVDPEYLAEVWWTLEPADYDKNRLRYSYLVGLTHLSEFYGEDIAVIVDYRQTANRIAAGLSNYCLCNEEIFKIESNKFYTITINTTRFIFVPSIVSKHELFNVSERNRMNGLKYEIWYDALL